MKEIFFHSWPRYLSCLIYGILILVVYNCLRNWVDLVNYMDALFIAGFSLLCIGGLSIVNYFGGFDIYTYMFAKRGANGQKPSLYEYSMDKKEQRKKQKFKFIPYLVFAAFYIIISGILMFFVL